MERHLPILISLLTCVALIVSGCTSNNDVSEPIPTSSLPISTSEPASFSLSNIQIVSPTGGFHPKKPVTISVNVKNAGGTTGDYTATLKIVGENGTFDFPKTITLYQGFNETISWAITTNSYGTFSISIDNMSGSFTVSDPIVTFPDPIFEALIRWKIEKPLGSIYGSDLLPITSFIASGEGIKTISGLEYCHNLKDIIFGLTFISDLTPLSKLENLTSLEIWGSSIRDLSPLSNLTQLKTLMINNGFVSDISPLNTLNNLNELNLSRNMISDISPIGMLTSIKKIVLNENLITDISPLSNLADLNSLYLVGNQITDISSLSRLSLLENLSLYSNHISNITPLKDLINLKTLIIGNNLITDISSLSYLHNLEDLDMGNNLIINITALSNLVNLKWLEIDNNRIADIHPLIVNQGISSGNGVYLVNNPLNAVSNSVYIPQLKARGVLMDFEEILNAKYPK